MLIEKFVVPASELADVGLQSIEMSRLGRFVALTGKNGAGKSRILNKLEQFITLRNQFVGNQANIEQAIQGYRNAIDNHPPEESSQASWKQQLDGLLIQRYAADSISSPISSSLGVLRFVPKQLNLTDPRQHHKSALVNLFNETKSPGLNGFETKCFSYIQRVQDREWAASHQRASHEPLAKQEAKEGYERLVFLINLLLKTKIDRSIDDDATLFGKPLAEAGLSDGQKVLIQLAVALHAQKGKLDNTVFLLDEPENHLHPSALIEFLDTVAEVASNAQFWIATHSVPLLAHIANKEPMSI
jgi:energy-coupling factor transporter ATP-binding protein EcfA2